MALQCMQQSIESNKDGSPSEHHFVGESACNRNMPPLRLSAVTVKAHARHSKFFQ